MTIAQPTRQLPAKRRFTRKQRRLTLIAMAGAVLCLAAGGWLPGNPILPVLIERNHEEYCAALNKGHETFRKTGVQDLSDLHAMIARLLDEQLASAAA